MKLLQAVVVFVVMASATFAQVKYEETITSKGSGTTNLQVMPSASVWVFDPGCITNGADLGTTIDVHSCSNVQNSDVIEVNGQTVTVTNVTATVITVDSSVTWNDLDPVLRTNSEVTIYSDPAGASPITQPAIADGNGVIRFWTNTQTFDVKATTSVAGTRIYAGANAFDPASSVTGPSSSVDNAVARYDGTTGLVIQDYTSQAPTFSDTGTLTVNAAADILIGAKSVCLDDGTNCVGGVTACTSRYQFTEDNSATPDITGTRYISLVDGFQGGSLGSKGVYENVRNFLVPGAMTISNFRAFLDNDPSPGDYTVTMFAGGSTTGLTCNLAAGSAPTSCTDLVNTSLIATGDDIVFQIIANNSPANNSPAIEFLFCLGPG